MRTKSTSARRYLTRSEVARLFEVAPATVTRWSREGKLPCVRTLGGQRRYLRDQVTRLALLTGSGAHGVLGLASVTDPTVGDARHSERRRLRRSR